MKTLILSDVHNQNLKKTIKTIDELIEKEKPDKLAFLGDCDLPEIYEHLLNLRVDKRIAIGNHELAWSNNIVIYSSLFESQPGDYIEWWNNHPDLKEFVLKNAKLEGVAGESSGKIVIDSLSGKKVVYSHCGIAWNKSLDSDFCLKLELWGTICDSFNKMKEKDYWLWFKGHDHASQIFALPLNANPFEIDYKERHSPVVFNSEKRYIIRVGCFALGVYAVLDGASKKLEFKNLFIR